MLRAAIRIWGDGDVVRDYIHVDDLAEAVAASITATPASLRILNVGSGQGATLNLVVSQVRAACGRDIETIHEPGRAVDVPWSVLDIRAAARELGWSPRVELLEGVSRTWAWICREDLRPTASR